MQTYGWTWNQNCDPCNSCQELYYWATQADQLLQCVVLFWFLDKTNSDIFLICPYIYSTWQFLSNFLNTKMFKFIWNLIYIFLYTVKLWYHKHQSSYQTPLISQNDFIKNQKKTQYIHIKHRNQEYPTKIEVDSQS